MLGCIQPMSSPIMKRMLGFCVCCAAAGMLDTIKAASNVNTPSQVILIGTRIVSAPRVCNRPPAAQTPPARHSHRYFVHLSHNVAIVARCSATHQSLKAAQPIALCRHIVCTESKERG